MTRQRLQLAGDELRQCRLAVAVLAKKRDAIVVIDPEIEAAQYGLFSRVTGSRSFEPQKRAGDRLLRVGKMKRHNAVVDLRRDRLQLRQRLDAALRLRRLAGLRLEAIDESLQVPALL